MPSAIDIQDLCVERRTPQGDLRRVLDIERFQLAEKEEVCLVGGSGSGKTTFLNVAAGILKPTTGKVEVHGQDLALLSEAARDRFRAREIGYVFQSFNLLQGLTALENLALAQKFAGADGDEARRRALELLGRVGLGRLIDQKPARLSVGEQQRVAIARALVNQPALVLADEPSANLDTENAVEALALLREVVSESGAALCLVTHDPSVRDLFERVVPISEISR